MAQVAEYKIGNTTMRIFDDACCTDPAEIEGILRRISRLACCAVRRPQPQGEAAHSHSTNKDAS